jgi:hypothetical protein
VATPDDLLADADLTTLGSLLQRFTARDGRQKAQALKSHGRGWSGNDK